MPSNTKKASLDSLGHRNFLTQITLKVKRSFSQLNVYHRTKLPSLKFTPSNMAR